VKRVASSVAVVRFSLVHRHISLNLEPDHWSSLGKSPNLNLNLPERFFRSGSGFGEVENLNWTEIFYFYFYFLFLESIEPKEYLGSGSQRFTNWTQSPE
jgi:hypothetical protein